jgi:TolB-like protein
VLAQALDRVLDRKPGSVPGVAIRPLAAASAALEAAQLADGVCEAMAAQLSRLPALRVVPCRSTRLAVATALDDGRLARLLAVNHVLSGSVEPLPAERVRVRLALHEVGSRGAAWRIEDEIALGELQRLPLRVSAETGRVLGQPASAPPAAPLIDAALYAKHLRAGQLSRREALADKRQALALLDEVLAAAPDYAPALYLHLVTRQRLAGNESADGKRLSPEQTLALRESRRQEALALARRVLAANPQELRGASLMMSDEIYTLQWAAAFERMDAVQQQHPRATGVLPVHARIHLHAGYVQRARELAQAALQINALDHEALEVMVMTSGMQGDTAVFREMLELARRAGHEGLGYSDVMEAYRRADWPEVQRRLTAWVAWGGKWSAAWVPEYMRGLGPGADPTARAASVRLLDNHDAATRSHFAQYFIEYALLGAHEQAAQSVLRQAQRPPAIWMQWLWWPELAPMRQQAAFMQAMHALKLPALWQRRGAPDLCHLEQGVHWVCR